MDNKFPSDPATAYASPTALPPVNTVPADPAEAYGGIVAPPIPPQGILGAVSEALKAQPQMTKDFLSNPVTQAKALPLLAGGAAQAVGIPASVGVGGGNLLADAALASYGKSDQMPSIGTQALDTGAAGLGDLVGPAKSFFTAPESLKNAGINATTLEHMAPGGQAPGDWTKAVESQLKDNGVLGNTANSTWKLMNTKANKVGANITGIMNQIGQASPEALQVDAQSALQPLANKLQTFGKNMYSEAQSVAKPFQEALQSLSQTAQQQGGKLTLDNIDQALKQTGEMMNGGQEAIEKYGPVYGKIADVRDQIVQGVATQSGNPGLASDLLKNNADYSTYMRLMPSVEKSAYKEAVKEGVSAYQKHIGPLGEKMAVAGGAYAVARTALDKLMGTQ